MQRQRILWVIAVVLCAALIGASYLFVHEGYGSALLKRFPKPVPVAPGYYRVTQVFDGDTIEVDMAGTREKVRFIGVDTPETHKPDTPVQCFGPEASAFTARTLAGATVRLEADPTNDNRDRYDRLLRYVYTEDGRLMEQLLIEQGYGFAYTLFPFQKKQEFTDYQETARQVSAGLWTSCRTTYKNGAWHTEYPSAP